MKKLRNSISVLLLVATILGCKSALYNIGLEKLGVYKDSITLVKVESQEKEVVFFPMVHIGTELIYEDVSKKIDSLKTLGFTFYLESVQVEENNDSLMRKYRKISGIAFNKNGYTDNIDSLFKGKFKPKKPIISQPSYKVLGIDSISGRVVDRTLIELINYYEQKNGEIKLEECDFQTSIFEKTLCKDPEIDEDVIHDYRINYRNEKVVQEILTDTAKKIAVIYGAAHIRGIKKDLKNSGFSEY